MKQKDIKREIIPYSLSLSKGFQSILISFLFLVLVGVPIVLATNGGTTGGWKVPNPLGEGTTFETLVVSIATWIRNLAIPVVVIFMIYSGVLFMTSGGNEEKIEKAKKTFFWTIIGTAIILIGSGFISLIKDILQMK